MIDTTMLIRLANSWRKQARNAQDVDEARTLEQCATQLASLITGGAIEVKARPIVTRVAS